MTAHASRLPAPAAIALRLRDDTNAEGIMGANGPFPPCIVLSEARNHLRRTVEADMWRLALLWLASLVGTALLASGLTFAQDQPPGETILSGSDLGFRLEGYAMDGRPTGKLVIRLNGEWVEPGFGVSTRRVR